METIWNRWSIPVLLAAVAMMLCGCPDPVEPSINVQDQDLEADERDTITIDEATIDADGFVVLFGDDDGQPEADPMAAGELIDQGDHTNLEIELDEPLERDQTMWAVLHYDDERGEFERTDKQPPVTDDDGQRVMDDFEVTVEEVDPPDPELSLTIDDQTIDEEEPHVIEVNEATIDDDGFVVIYSADEDDPDDQPGDDIHGASDLLEDGTHTDFDIELDIPVEEDGDTLWGVLHYDETGEGEFVDEDDQPPIDIDDDRTTDSFVVNLEEDPDPDPPVDEPFISVSDQTLTDLSTVVNVDEVEALDPGWVAIHEGGCDAEDPGEVLGNEEVDEGTHTDMEVELERPAADMDETETHCAMLYTDDDPDTFDLDVAEQAVDDDEETVMDEFDVTVEDGTPAVRMTLDTDPPQTYTVENVEPTLFEDDVEDPDDSPLFTFRDDWRYEFVNEDTDDNPFEFIDDEQPPEAQLSQTEEGALEDVDAIDWVEDDDTFLFTVDGNFQANVSAYHSAAQPNMTGDIRYED